MTANTKLPDHSQCKHQFSAVLQAEEGGFTPQADIVASPRVVLGASGGCSGGEGALAEIDRLEQDGVLSQIQAAVLRHEVNCRTWVGAFEAFQAQLKEAQGRGDIARETQLLRWYNDALHGGGA